MGKYIRDYQVENYSKDDKHTFKKGKSKVKKFKDPKEYKTEQNKKD